MLARKVAAHHNISFQPGQVVTFLRPDLLFSHSLNFTAIRRNIRRENHIEPGRDNRLLLARFQNPLNQVNEPPEVFFVSSWEWYTRMFGLDQVELTRLHPGRGTGRSESGVFPSLQSARCVDFGSYTIPGVSVWYQ